MKRRNLMVTILLALIALFAAFAFSACGGGESDDTPIAEGPETGEYYCDSQSGAEYTISLHDGNKVDFKVQDYDLKGTYSVSGESLSFSFEAEPRTVSASLRDDVLTVTLGSDVMRFWKKISYSVVYMSDGAQYKTETVLNGRSAPRPDDPVKTNYVFIEWYSDSAYHNLYDFTQPVRGNVTLYARFEAPIEPEFDVTLDYNGGNVTGPKTVTTVGGKLFTLPTPTRDGYTFAGWWVSHFDSADKLTYRYEEQSIDQPTTLYAVWDDGKTPLVSIYEDGLRWSAGGVNNSYKVKFTGPDGEEIVNRSFSTTSYAYNFAQKEAGEYAVEVTLNDKTAKAYFNNKALSAVSAWSVENSIFRWNAVPYAESYTVTVECDDPNHVHNGTVSAYGELKFDFSACGMPADGIKFTVTASAEGYLSSVSETFKVKRTLDAVQDVAVDEATAVLSWAAVKNATGYIVSVLQDGGEPQVYTVGADVLSYGLKSLERGKYTVSVQPTAKGWLSPAASAYTYDKVRLASPSNIHVEGLSVVWDAPVGANSYTVTIDGVEHTTDTNSYDLTGTMIGDGITVSVVASDKNNAAVSSPASDPLKITNGRMGAVRYGAGTVTWDAVLGVSEFIVKVNEGPELNVTGTSLAIQLTKKGDNVISVRGVLDNGGNTDWANCTVTAYAIEFDVNNGNVAVDSLYYAEGDTIGELPEGYRTGYDFEAWYTAAQGGDRYTGGVMSNVDLTLHAHWTAKEYTITLNAGTYGTLTTRSYTVTYDQMYQLPVPSSTNLTKAFAAWRTSQGGAGVAYTDFDGNSLFVWRGTQDLTLYAQWVEIFEFTLNAEKTEWSVSKGEGIQYVRKVTIPEEYGDATSDGMKPVTMVNDFANCKVLEEINIPAQVRNISLGGTQGVAFMGCSALQAVNIYMGKYNDAPVYESADGVLLYNNSSTGTKELVFYPLGKLTDEYTVPDKVQSILNGVFRNAKFSKVTIPASVTLIETDAFAACANLTEVEFLPSEGEAGSIEIREKAFDSLGKLQTITLPDRLASFSPNIFYSCKALLNVYLPNETSGYSSTEDGLLIKSLQGGGKELAYYPYGRDSVLDLSSYHEITSIGSDAIARIASYGGDTSNEQITKVVIPAWVTNIGAKAFKDCTKLTEVTFLRDDGVDTPLTIGEGAFFNCEIQSLELPNVPLSIGDKAFYGRRLATHSSPITELTLPEKLTHVGSYAFGNMPELTTINVNTACDKATSGSVFSSNVFASAQFDPAIDDDYTVKSPGIAHVTTVNLGDNTYVNIASVFGKQVEAVHVNQTNQYYQEADGVLFDKEMTEIAFYPDSKVGSFDLPATVVSISANLFASKTQITAVTIPATVESIGEGAFNGCTGLTSVTFTDAVGEGAVKAERLDIGNRAFFGCNNLKTIELPERTKIVGDSAFAVSTRMKGLTSVQLNEGLEEIGAQAFYKTALKEVTIPSTVTKLGSTTKKEKVISAQSSANNVEVTLESCEAFGLCDALAKITVEQNNKAYMDVDGILYKRGEVTLSQGGAAESRPTELLYVPMSYHNASGTLEIPNTVTKVWTFAFYCMSATSFYAGNPCNITKVKFENDALAEVYNAETQAMEMPTLTVDTYAFYDTGKVTSVIFPEGYRTLKTITFTYGSITSSLTSIELPASLTLIESKAIYGVKSLTTVKFREPKDGAARQSLVIGNAVADSPVFNVFNGCTALTTLVLPERTTEIRDYAFGNTTGITNSYLKSVTLPSTLTKIGRYAFSLLELDHFEFKSSDTASLEIDGFAFTAIKGLRSMSLPTVTSIGANAFTGSTISSIDFGSKLTSIGNQAFKGTNLTGVLTFPASLQSIGDNAFLELSGITEIKFTKPSTVPGESQRLTIGEYAFQNCVNLAKVNFEDSYLQSLGRDAFRNTKIKSVQLPWTISTLGMYAFADNDLLDTVEFLTVESENNGKSCLKEIGDWAFQYSLISEFSLPESSEDEVKLGKKLFVGCSSLTNIHLSAQVMSIANVFDGCGSIGEITVQAGNPNFSSKPGQKMLFDASGKSVLLVYAEIEDGVFTVADGAQEVSGGAFKGQIGLKKVVLPTTLLTIGDSAFEDCINLQEVTFAGSDWSQLQSIGASAFKNCTSLETFSFDRTSGLLTKVSGSTVEQYGIGANAFENCYKLQTVDLSHNTGLTQIGNYAFKMAGRNTTDDKPFEVKLPNSVEFLGTYTFQGSGLRSIDLSGLTSLVKLQDKTTATTSTSTKVYTFSNCTKLTEVKLPEHLIYIGGYVFENCASLKKINLEKVQALGEYAFHGCAALTGDQPENYGTDPNVFPNLSVDLSALTAIGKDAFEDSGVISIKFTSNMSTSSSTSNVFQNCTSLEYVSIEDSGSKMTYISSNMFKGCEKLKQITIPRSVTNIASQAFYGTGLLNITIPNTVTNVGAGAFAYCDSLTSVTFDSKDANTKVFTSTGLSGGSSSSFPGTSFGIFESSAVTTVDWGDRVVTIPIRMFYECKSLTSITIPSSVTTINAYAFAHSAITSIHLPKTVTSLNSTGHQFDGCESLSDVTFEDGYKTAFQPQIFANCTALTSFAFPDGVTATSNYMFQGSGIKSVTWNKVTTIGSYAFRNTQLETLSIPAQISKLNNYAFADCTKLTSVTFETDPVTGKTKAADLATYLFSGCTNLQSVTFADGITDFGDNTFDGCENLSLTAEDLSDMGIHTLSADLVNLLYGGQTEIVVDDVFTEIAKSAFDGTEFTSVQLPNGLQTIGESAFANTKFTSIEIPTTVTSIGNKAFDSAAITSFTLPSSVTTYGDYLFQKSALQSIQLPDDMTHITDSMFAESALKSIKLPSKLQTIESKAFYKCVDLASVDFNGNTTMTEFLTWDAKTNKPGTTNTAYSSSIFEGCTSLTGIDLPTSLISIGFNTFKNSGLKRIDLTRLTGLKTTMGRAVQTPAVGTTSGQFDGCENLTEVLLPDSLGDIVGNVFRNTKSLTSITLPRNLTLIGNSAFNGSAITSISLPGTITTLGTSIFSGCADLEEVTIGGGITTLTSKMFENCTSLKSLTIPASVNKINADTFKGCGSLSITNESLSFTLDENGHFLLGGSTIYALANGGELADATLTIPANVTIPNQQFFVGTKVKQLAFEEGFTTIPASVFYGIEAEEVVFPESLVTIGSKSFEAAKIGKMTIPATVATIPANAFESATIEELTLEGVYSTPTASVFKKATIGKIVFAEGSNIGDGWFEGATLSADFTLDNVVSIGKTAFKDAVIEGTLNIPTCVTTIGGGAFANLELAKVNIDMGEGDPLTIGDGGSASEALFGSTKFETFDLPDRLVALGNYAFASNTELTHIALPAGLTSIGNSAFSGCTALGSIELPASLTSIGTSAFSGCSTLTSVKMSESVISIGASAFSSCKQLKSIYIPYRVATLSSSVFTGWDSTQTVYVGMSQYTFFQLFGSSFYTSAAYNFVFDVTMEDYEALQSAQG